MTIKDILESIQLYFDFINDLINLGLISSESLNSLTDFYTGKLENNIR